MLPRILGLNFSGFVAWWLWRTIYLLKLPRFEKKLRVALDWTLDIFFSKDSVQYLHERAPVIVDASDVSPSDQAAPAINSVAIQLQRADEIRKRVRLHKFVRIAKNACNGFQISCDIGYGHCDGDRDRREARCKSYNQEQAPKTFHRTREVGAQSRNGMPRLTKNSETIPIFARRPLPVTKSCQRNRHAESPGVVPGIDFRLRRETRNRDEL